MKLCKECGNEKRLDEFHKSSSNRDGLQIRCKVCESERHKRRTAKMSKMLLDLKDNTCDDCGIEHDNPRGFFEWHHSDPSTKIFNVGKYDRSIESQLAEMEKCVLLCPNCHKNRHLVEGMTRGELISKGRKK